ncbi:MAG: hypothetical protein ABL998_00820 [Planctomycetota bacterium]
MTIPTRTELIERARCHWYRGPSPSVTGNMADFALAEIRRAVREELEALRDDMAWDAVVFARISRRLAALGEHTDKPGAESQALTASASERAEGRAASSPCPPPALTDADALERVSKLLREDGISEASPGVLSKWAAVLRAARAELARRDAGLREASERITSLIVNAHCDDIADPDTDLPCGCCAVCRARAFLERRP